MIQTVRYADDVLKQDNSDQLDIIEPATIDSLADLFQERVRRSPDKTAYQQYDKVTQSWVSYSWSEMDRQFNRWKVALNRSSLSPACPVVVQMHNSVEWVLFDQAALAVGLIVVPVFVEDRSDNVAYILEDTQAELLVVHSHEQWLEIEQDHRNLDNLKCVVVVNAIEDARNANKSDGAVRVVELEHWLNNAADNGDVGVEQVTKPSSLATIVYTSGTTGKPKGVMLSHENIYGNAYAGLQSIAVYPQDRFLSFLPLSHMFERTVGYYLTMMCGAEVIFNRSIAELTEDIQYAKPTILVSVPRIFERVQGRILSTIDESSALSKWLFHTAVEIGWHRFEHQQRRASWTWKLLAWPILDLLVAKKIRKGFGGSLRLAICGGAKLSPNISKMFLGLGVDILQGYGLTESSPVISVNTIQDNKPQSIGLAYHGVELKLTDQSELLCRSPYTMLGYWQNPKATAESIDSDGWLSTGDVAKIDEDGFIFITGRIKEIIVLANGEKVPPADMESAITDDPVFEQVMIVGEGKPFLTALVVLNHHSLVREGQKLGFNETQLEDVNSNMVSTWLLGRISNLLSEFPGYAFVRYVHSTLNPWTIEDGLITPTLKLKRPMILQQYASEINRMYG